MVTVITVITVVIMSNFQFCKIYHVGSAYILSIILIKWEANFYSIVS